LFSFDEQKLEKFGPATDFSSMIKKYYSALYMPRLNLGIDLKGGTYLVLGVDVEKAVENKLVVDSKSIDDLFKEKRIAKLPEKKFVKNGSIVMDFDDPEHAKVAYNLIAAEMPSLKLTRSGGRVQASLSSSERRRIQVGSVEQAVNVLSTRLGEFGVEGISVQKHGQRQIVVQIPGVSDPERVKNLITKTAHLEFKIVEKQASSKQELLDDFDGDLPPDKMIVPGKRRKHDFGDLDDEEGRNWYLVSAYPALTGEHLVDARMGYDERNSVVVNFALDNPGAKKFRKLTSNNIGKPLAVIIDDVVVSVASIGEAIGARGRISGIGSVERVKDLALVLRSGSLSAPLRFEQENRVGATLGQDSIRRGIVSCLVALLLLLLFSIFYYKSSGVFAIFALVYNLFLVLLFLSYFRATLTLPGIAGMVLTIGMAIDASILIYERIKEELRKGSPYKKAVKDGFSGAMAVIIDSNITTFLTGLVLFKFGGPAIKGFAVTLMVGIIATILAGVFFLRSIFDFATNSLGLKRIRI